MMNNQPRSGSQAGQHGGKSGAGVEQSTPALSISARDNADQIRTVGLFVPKRLAPRLAQAVDLVLTEILPIPMTTDEWLRKEALLELRKALTRAGYVRQ